jgi:uncharacterized protein
LQLVVLDTNVIVSALLVPRGGPGRVLSEIEGRAILLASEPTLAEIREVLHRPKFEKLVSAEARDEFIERYAGAVRVVPVSSLIRICRDPRDDKLLELAIDGKANAVVTGDQDLLILNPFRGVQILSPRAFLEALHEGHWK